MTLLQVQWHACEAAARILSASSASSALPCDLDGLATALAEILEACENYKVCSAFGHTESKPSEALEARVRAP